ncbi:hypothetical protein ACIQWL_20955 [Streptomyces mirabilis]|uniref:hypothetical protein n=1 Tax=Streptomyces mirabilis TaxID=68239 RepID=UPI0033CA901D
MDQTQRQLTASGLIGRPGQRHPVGGIGIDAQADYTDGMLTVSVGMGAEKPSAKHVEIQHGS